jgi:mannose-6-phosphate isomerase-like protein (cupin superfamily)
MSKLTSFIADDKVTPVSFVETQTVKEGVECDIYTFVGDSSKDLAVVTVSKGHKTPLQRVLLGTKTVEGYVAGKGTLTVYSNDVAKTYAFKTGGINKEVLVEVGQTMQWHADGNIDLIFYEICEPPYEDGRFENLAS